MKTEIRTLIETLKKLRPVAAINKLDNTFPRGICVGDGRIQAASPMFSVVLDMPDAADESPFILPIAAVDLLMGLPRELDEVDITAQAEKVHIKCGTIKACFASRKADEFPTHHLADDAAACTIDWVAFEAKLSSILYACAKDAARPVLQGVRFFTSSDTLNMVATDTYRLAWERMESPTDADVDCVVPREALLKLGSIIDAERVTIGIGKSNIRFSTDRLAFTARLVDGNYPNIEKVVPMYENTSSISIHEVLGVMQRVRALCQNVVLSIDGSTMLVRGNDASVSYSEEVCLAQEIGLSAEVGVSTAYCIDAFSALKASGVSNVDIGFSNEATAIRPITLRTPSFCGLILPVKILR